MARHNMAGYKCRTEPRNENLARGLCPHLNPGSRKVHRWRPKSKISNFVSSEGLGSDDWTFRLLTISMRTAVQQWHHRQIGIHFAEVDSSAAATFTVVYNVKLIGTFALAFFPGDFRRLIEVGPPRFERANYSLTPHVLCH
jgi:hypothetical protein